MAFDLKTLEAELSMLIPRIANGDQQAFARLYDLMAGRLNGVIYRILRKPELSEEALQEAFVRIWQRASTYNPDHVRTFGWLVTIARNQAIDVKRRFAEKIAAQSDNAAELEIAVQPEAENAVEYSQLRQCLSKLPQDRQDMVLLAYTQGYSREELAARFSRPLATVKTLLRRSLLVLKECIDASA